MLRRRRSSDRSPDLAALPARWRPYVDQVSRARERFRRLVADTKEGPLRVRMEQLATQIDEAVASSIQVAERAARLDDAVAELGPQRLATRLKDARRRLEAQPGDELLEAEVRSLATQHGTANRLWNEIDDCERQLRLIDLRLDEAVARAADLVLSHGGGAGIDAIDRDLTGVVDDLGALRSALDDLR